MSTNPRSCLPHKSTILPSILVAFLAASCALRPATNATTPPGSRATPTPQFVSCVIDIQFDVSYWHGPISGCVLEGGTIEFRETPQNTKTGAIEHFYENFIIYPPGGGEITGHNEGEYNLATGKFAASGSVTDAPTAWAYMVGAIFNETGTTAYSGSGKITGFGTIMTLR
jgi:hypothetical protein